MTILQFIIPSILFGFFIYKARKSLIYVCAVPLIYCFAEAAFIRTVDFGFSIPYLPITLRREDIVFFMLVGVWWYVRQRRQRFKVVSLKLDTLLLGILLVLFVIQPPFKWIMGDPVYGSTLVFMARYCYIVFAFFLWMDIFRRFTREEVWQLVRAISIATALLMIFYIISSIGVKIYPFEAYRTYYERSVIIVRDFNTFPLWTGLALAYFLLSTKSVESRFRILLFLSILIIGSILTLTRTIIIVMMVMVCTVILYQGLIEKSFKGITILVSILAIGTLIVSIMTYSFFMPNVELFSKRFEEIGAYGLIYTPNVQGRLNDFLETLRYVIDIDPIFGFGFYSSGQWSLFPNIFGVYVIDSMWHQLVKDTGISGIICIGLLLAVLFMYSIRLCFKHELEKRKMGIFLVLAMIWGIGLSFIGQSYVVFAAGSVFPLALAAVEARDGWAVSPVTSKNIIPRITGIELSWFNRSPLHKLVGFLILMWIAYMVGSWIAR
jgi:hypothetical protein